MNARREPPASDALRVDIGARIRARRKAVDLSQSQLGNRLRNAKGKPVTGSQIAKWERGVFLPSRRYWPQLAAALDVSEAGIFGSLVETGEGPLVNRMDELSERLSVLADILGVSDETIDSAIRARRRLHPVSEPIKDEEIRRETTTAEAETDADRAKRVEDAARKAGAESRKARGQKSGSLRPKGNRRRAG